MKFTVGLQRVARLLTFGRLKNEFMLTCTADVFPRPFNHNQNKNAGSDYRKNVPIFAEHEKHQHSNESHDVYYDPCT